MKLLSTALLILLLTNARNAAAQATTSGPQATDIKALKAQIDALKAEYEKRIQDLEKQLDEIQGQMLKLSPESDAGDAVAVAPPAAPTVPGALNPAIGVVGNFLGRTDNRRVFLADGMTR